jgi:hypothetical protein
MRGVNGPSFLRKQHFSVYLSQCLLSYLDNWTVVHISVDLASVCCGNVDRVSDAMENLEKTYSRDQQRFSDGVATPVALVRSVTEKSIQCQRSLKSRGTLRILCAGKIQVAD